MDLNGLTVPDRSAKPRQSGLTWCIDDGVPSRAFRDTIASFHRIIDGVKFGWGTALVTDVIGEKIAVCREFGVDFSFGGTLFEAYWIQGRIQDFFDLVISAGCPVVEISDGTIQLPADERIRLIGEFKVHAKVFTEVGSKNPNESAVWLASDWIRQIERDRGAGADIVILETRESGTAGLCLPTGEIRSDIAAGILSSSLDPSYLMFEAPNKKLQTYWLQKLGSNVNLSNIPLGGSVNVETLRLGLRSDTFGLLTASTLFLP
ncbi:MAG: phosphosulfolactate synthase [Thermaerobacter sp.]|nr:phosphosulfolactate synthase [Thermaerobacter sp.]